jgi:hypothetical protein
MVLGLRCGRVDCLEDAEWEEIEDRLLQDWPADWPGRSVVDLDNLGDPGAWLRDGVGESWYRVLFADQDDERWATELAEFYAENLVASGYPMPSEFGDHPVYGVATEDDRAWFQTEFMGFLSAWRERVLKLAELRTVVSREPNEPPTPG